MNKNTSIMIVRLTICIISLIAGTLIIGCNNGNKQTKNSENKELKEEPAQENEMENILCFRNEYPYQGTATKKDIEELKLTIENGKVTGTYKWLPAEKDKREGTLIGTIKNNVIEVLYIFFQEGVTDTANLKIIFDDDKALISGGKPELGLNTSIKKIDCNTY